MCIGRFPVKPNELCCFSYILAPATFQPKVIRSVIQQLNEISAAVQATVIQQLTTLIICLHDDSTTNFYSQVTQLDSNLMRMVRGKSISTSATGTLKATRW